MRLQAIVPGALILILGLADASGARAADEDLAPAGWAAPPYWLSGTARDRDGSTDREAAGRRTPLAPAPVALPFFALPPCRVADTRPAFGFSGAYGPPFMAGSAPRSFPITGQCGIPAGAAAVSFNFTVTNTAGPGFLLVYPQGGPPPNVSTLNYVAGQTLANAAVVPLGAGGGLTAIPGVSGFDLIIDVNGYYAPTGVVNTVNTLQGDVVLAAGTNISIAPTGNTLTITATGTAGGVTSLAGTNGISASPATGAVTVTSNATASSTPSTIVARDSFNGFSVGSINLGAFFNLAQTTASAGIVNMNGDRFLHAFGTENTFLGTRAGNLTLTGNENVGVGVDALSGTTNGAANTAVGWAALKNTSSGIFNSAFGVQALTSNTSGGSNAAFGEGALFATNGGSNAAFGTIAMTNHVSGSQNAAFGTGTLNQFTTGSFNVALGSSAGSGLVSGSNNIYLGANVFPATNTESGTIRIGMANQTVAFMAGIRGVTPNQPNALPVVIDSNGQLGTATGVPPSGAAGGGLSGTYPNPTVVSSSTNTPLSVVSRDVIGSFGAGTVILDADLFLPATDVAATAGAIVLNGARFMHARGTNNTFLGRNAGATTLTVGTAVDDTGVGFTALQSLTTGHGNAALGSGALAANTTGDLNAAFGHGALNANVSGIANAAFGQNALHVSTGSDNSAFGQNALVTNVGGSNNSAFGVSALQNNVSGFDNAAFGSLALLSSTGNQNSALGSQALANTTGFRNIGVGYHVGIGLGSGSDNILIGADVAASGESTTIRIGSTATHTAAYLAGVYSATIGGSGLAVSVDSSGKLGTLVSSRRYKEEIADIGDDSDVLMKLRPVSFLYKADSDATRIRQYGLIAEEVAAVAPGLAVFDAEGRPETVRYHLVNAMLLNEVQKQRKTIEELLRRLERLESASKRAGGTERTSQERPSGF